MLFGRILRRLRFLLHRESEWDQLQDEMQFHRDLRARQFTADGLPHAEAVARAAQQFGNTTHLGEQGTDMWGWIWLEDFWRDLRQTGRMLAAHRAFAAVVILTLALGIGANTAIFSVTNAVLLKRMPVRDPQQLYRVSMDHMPFNASNTGNANTSFSYAVFDALRQQQTGIAEFVAYAPLGLGKVPVRTTTLPEESSADIVSGNFFTGLGVQPACGRLLSSQDEENHTPVAVASFPYAAHHFGDPCSALGRTIYIKGLPFTVIGIAAKMFAGVESLPTDLWIPFSHNPQLNAWGSTGKSYRDDPGWWCLLMMARVKPEHTNRQAEEALLTPFQRATYARTNGKTEPGEKPSILHLAEARGIAGADSSRDLLTVLQTLVGLLLLIACGNVSMLLSARNTARAREFSVRLALGGSRTRLVRQLFAESLLFVTCGTVLGLAFAVAGTRILGRWADLDISPLPDRNVLLFTMALSVATALLFGVTPAIRAAHISVIDSLKNSAATAHRDGSRLPAGNVICTLQLALCLTLLVGTGLLVRTIQNLKAVNTGLKTAGLVVFGVDPPRKPSPEASVAFYRNLIASLRTVPGIESVTVMGNRIASGWSNNTDVLIDGRTPLNIPNPNFRWNNVGPNFFSTLGIPILSGRDFDDSDSDKTAAVAIVDRTFAKRFFGGRNPIGHKASYTDTKSFTIVGLVADSKYSNLQEEPKPMAWFPYAQVGAPGTLHVEVRSATSPEIALTRIRVKLATIAPDLAMLQPETQVATFERNISGQQLLAYLSIIFGMLAVLLVTIGLYGTISYTVARRTVEVGIRMALGAERSQVIWTVVRSSLALSLAGLVLGIPLALVSGKLLSSSLYGVAPNDALAIATASLGIVLISVIATYLPARRAAAIQPITALRYE